MYKLGGKYQRFAGLYGRLILTIVILGMVVIAGALISIKSKDRYAIPGSMTSRLSFPVLFLKNPTPLYKLDESSLKYSTQPDGSAVFSFIIRGPRGSITFSEQAYPEALIYDNFTNSLNPYSDVGTTYGTVTLGKPKDAGGRPIAGFKYNDSTLILAQPSSNVSDSDWRTTINSLKVVD